MPENETVHIICIDDDPDLSRLVRVMLEPYAFKVTEVNSGASGLQLIHTRPPDLVLLDLMMPDMDGWEVYEQMRKDPDLQEIPVIVITARSNRMERELGRILGVDDYLVKPFTRQELLERIQRALEASP
ncbi:MAG: two-component system response regulator [Anaerolineales bacterium]